jgi:hypothetical protein
MIEQSISSLLRFGDDSKPQDDITILGLELKEADPKS